MALLESTRTVLDTAQMTPEQFRDAGFEIAMVGMNGINVNDPASQCRLRALPGTFRGLQVLCCEYIAFKFCPRIDIGFDVSREFAEAQDMKKLVL